MPRHRPEPGDPDYDWSQPYRWGGRKALEDAKAFLSSDRAVSPVPTSADLDTATRRTTVKRKPLSLRGLTDIAETASLPTGLAGMIPSPASPALLGLSAALLAPGALRKTLAPEEDESALEGAIQTGLVALPGVGAVRRAGRGVSNLTREPKSFGEVASKQGVNLSKEVPYASRQVATNPSQTLGVAREVAEETGEPLGRVLKGKGGRTGFARGESLDALLELAGAGKRGKAIRRANERKGLVAEANRQGRMGARTVPSSDNPLIDALPEGGLGTITPAEQMKFMAGSRRSQVTDLQDVHIDDEWTALNELLGSPKRQGIPARSRAFRSNKPFPE